MAALPQIRLGTILWAEVNEPSGTPAGRHPAIVLNPQHEIDAGMDLSVVVCSRNFSYPLPSGWFDIPTKPGPGGHPMTKLDQACVAKATWPQVIPQSAVLSVAGRAPVAICRQIIQWQNEQRQKMNRP